MRRTIIHLSAAGAKRPTEPTIDWYPTKQAACEPVTDDDRSRIRRGDQRVGGELLAPNVIGRDPSMSSRRQQKALRQKRLGRRSTRASFRVTSR